MGVLRYHTTDIEATATRYTPYERAVIIGRAVMRLLEQRPADTGADPSEPPAHVSPALRRLVAQIAQEVAGAKARAREPIVRKVEQLTQQVAAQATTTEPLPHPATRSGQTLERAVQALAEHLPVKVNAEPHVLHAALTQLHQAMPRARGDTDARIGHTSTGEGSTSE